MFSLGRCHCCTTWTGTVRGAVNAVVQGGTRPCRVLMVRTMVKVDLALPHSFATTAMSFLNRIFDIAESVHPIIPFKTEST